MQVALVIPALDEEESIGPVVRAHTHELARLGHAVVAVVADNGSVDETARRASDAGARVVFEGRRGYGSACLAALRVLDDAVDVVVFADGDGADDPADLAALLAPIAASRADLVIGSRAEGERLMLVERGALTVPQRFGNALASGLLGAAFDARVTDLGPFRAVTRAALDRLAMDDPDFGWTIQMQARALARGLRVVEVPVRYHRRRAGRSKVSGDVRGALLAGAIILRTLAREALAHGSKRAVRRAAPRDDTPRRDT